jgi:hypothetical protein
MMRSHNILLGLILLGSSAGVARAEKVAFMADLAGGVTIPVSDDNYREVIDTSFKLSLKAGAVFYVHPRFGVAAEGQFDWVAVNTDDDYFVRRYAPLSFDARFNRVRFLGGARFIIPFGIGSFYLRAALGVDYLTGSVTTPVVLGQSLTCNPSSTAFTFEPGFGVQFNVVRHVVLGVYTGFPIDSQQTLNCSFVNGVNISRQFTPVDIDILGVFGFRL